MPLSPPDPSLFRRTPLRQASLQAANDQISNAIANLPIFPYYSFDLDVL